MYARMLGLRKTMYWTDDDIDKFECVPFSILTDIEVIRCGQLWLRSIYGFPLSSFSSSIAILLALNIRHPETYEAIINPEDAYPVMTPDKRNVFDVTHERLTKSEEELQIRRPSGENEDLSLRCLDILEALKELESHHQAAFYCFLASVTCRLAKKPIYQVAFEIANDVLRQFRDFYEVRLPFEKLPKPTENRLKMISYSFRNRKLLTLVKCFVKNSVRASRSGKDNIKNLLDHTFLSHTADYGMNLMKLFMDAQKKIGKPDKDFLLSKINLYGAVESLKHIDDYFNMYLIPSSDKFISSDYVRWARLINPEYFEHMRPADHEILTIVLIAICEDGETGGRWNMKSLKIDSCSKESLVELVHPWKMKILNGEEVKLIEED